MAEDEDDGVQEVQTGSSLQIISLERVEDLEEIPLSAAHVQAVDRAMFVQACKGSVMAARLVYMRVFGGGLAPKLEEGPPPSLEELERMLRDLKTMRK